MVRRIFRSYIVSEFISIIISILQLDSIFIYTLAHLSRVATQLLETEYQWASFKQMNEVATRALTAVEGVRILDLHDVMDQRPDAHIGSTCAHINQYGDMGGDCLHWCFPGPLDIAAQVLLGILEGMQT